MRDFVVLGTDGNHLSILDDGADVDNRVAVRRRCGKFHHNGRVVRALESGKVPFRSSVVRLHALQGVDVDGLALEVDVAVLGGDGALRGAAGPECVAHLSPGVLEVCAEQRRARLSGLEAGSCPGDREVDQCPLVIHALDCVGVAILGQLDGAVIGIERRSFLVEGDVLERV